MTTLELLEQWARSPYLKNMYSSFEEFAEIQNKKQNNTNERVLGREGLFNDFAYSQAESLEANKKSLIDHSKDSDLYTRLANNQELRIAKANKEMDNYFKGGKHETI